MINVVFVPEEKIRAKVCVLIDVLRATSVIVTALANGATSVEPVPTLKQALVKKNKDVLVCGERRSVKPKGFDLGNSPLEYLSDLVQGKEIVLSTTNGTRAIQRIECEFLYAASFLNLSSIVRELKRHDSFTIVCSGQNGRIALEDVLCAGAIVALSGEKEKTDSALIAESVWRCNSSVFETISRSQHGRELIEKGFLRDVEYCSQIDLYSVVPIFDGSSFILQRSERSLQA
ncbi:2-phosphosulfolactate phosphatase [Thermotoga sp. Ku-13t]|nr:2-phosphosulfolactate phosphatase [Thermotoga sp. Ku-13t]